MTGELRSRLDRPKLSILHKVHICNKNSAWLSKGWHCILSAHTDTSTFALACPSQPYSHQPTKE